MAKQKIKIQSGGMPQISDYLNPPPPPAPPEEELRASPYQTGYKSYLDPETPGAQATFDSYFFNNAPLSGGVLSYDEQRRRQRLATGDGSSGSSAGEMAPTLAPRPEEPTEDDPFTTFMAQFQGQPSGGGMAAPDYSQYRQALTDQAGQINAQIQAMYDALGDEAAANVGRIEDIYGGAQAGIGDVYESAAANTADAYGSSQQQAADQLARLGIEAAAPAVVNPMALSQAEALSGLEAGRAGGEAATERYGASAGGFGSQMAQVAQQQGTEMNSAILAALQNRLNESLLMEEQGRQAAASSGGGGQSAVDAAMDYLRLQEMFNAPAMAQQELQLRAGEIAADNTLAQQDKLVRLWSDIRNDYGSDEEAWQAAQNAISQAQLFYR
jgi:hypothetical protein